MRPFVFLALLLAALGVLADYQLLTSKTCDGVEVELKKDERILIDFDRSLIVFGETQGECDYIRVFPFSIVKAPNEIFIVDDLGMGRDSCRPDEVFEVEGKGFSLAVVGESSVTFQDVDGCEALVYNY